MNEQIKQLWVQAAEKTQGDSWEEQTKFMERFAELIVKAVFARIEEERYDVYEPVKEAVMKHFGVEQ